MANEQDTTQSANAFLCGGEIRLLDGNPAREDEFGTHEALAEAISALICNEPGGEACTRSCTNEIFNHDSDS